MVVKTELCAFSEYRIYPGHGQKYVKRDGQLVTVATSKCMSMVLQHKKPSKLMWTQSWRRLNKKGKDEGIAKKRNKKTVRVQRNIGNVTKEDIAAKKQKTVKPDAATAAALKEVKDRQKAAKKAPLPGAASKTIIPKTQKTAQANSRGGAKR